MVFKKLPNNRGMIYEPDYNSDREKHPCPDCFSCQWCSNERCRVCRGTQVKGKKLKNKKLASGVIMCKAKKPNPKEFVKNFSSSIPLKKKISLAVRNNIYKLFHLKNCCGHPGEPGC
jgi:hypothetical protein